MDKHVCMNMYVRLKPMKTNAHVHRPACQISVGQTRIVSNIRRCDWRDSSVVGACISLAEEPNLGFQRLPLIHKPSVAPEDPIPSSELWAPTLTCAHSFTHVIKLKMFLNVILRKLNDCWSFAQS